MSTQKSAHIAALFVIAKNWVVTNAPPVGVADNRGGCTCVGTEGTQEISVPSSQFAVNLKLFWKKLQSLREKKKEKKVSQIKVIIYYPRYFCTILLLINTHTYTRNFVRKGRWDFLTIVLYLPKIPLLKIRFCYFLILYDCISILELHQKNQIRESFNEVVDSITTKISKAFMNL